MTPQRLQQLIDRFGSCRIAVVGDFFLDKYLDVDPSLAETSVETGKTAHQVISIRRSPGAAGTVVNNLSALQTGTLHAVGAVGDDGEAYELKKELEHRGCETNRLLQFESLMTPTYLKPRHVADAGLSGEQERYDTKNRKPAPADVIEKVARALDQILPNVDAVVIADQVEEDDCGVITAAFRDVLANRARKFPEVLFWADSRSHIRQFRSCITKPNQFEAIGHEHPQPAGAVDVDLLTEALPRLYEETGAPVCVTRGQDGAIVSDPKFRIVPGVRVEGPIDPTGAGDSFTAGAVLTLAAGGTLAEAALAGNLVASITIQQLATTGSATPEQVVERLQLWREQNIED